MKYYRLNSDQENKTVNPLLGISFSNYSVGNWSIEITRPECPGVWPFETEVSKKL